MKTKSEFVFGEDYENQMHAIGDWVLAYPAVERVLGNPLGKTILDFGCGTGKFSRRLRNLGANVIAVDREASSIESAKNRGVGIDYKVIENEDLSFLEPSSVDHAVATFSFCMIENEEKMKRTTRQIVDKIRPNGYFVILDPHPNGLGYEFVSVWREQPKIVESYMPVKVKLTGLPVEFYDYWKSKEDYVKAMEDSGLEVDRVEEPKPRDNFDFWKDEKIQSPYLIIKGKKVAS